MAGPFYLYIFTLIFAPLAFGTVEYWSLGLIEAVIPLSVLLLTAYQLTNKARPCTIPGLLPLGLLLCWMTLQLLPLPPAVVQIIAPKIYQIYQPILQLSDQSFWIPLTVQPKATLQELFRFSTYGLFFILTVQLLSQRTYLQKTVTIVAWLGTAIAVEAIIQKLTSPHAIYWFRTSPQSMHPIGPWVYSNHFAGFTAMLFPLVLALFLYYRPGFDDKQTLRSKIVALFTMPGTNTYLLFGFAAFLMGVAILLSVSRGGIITLCLALFFFVILSNRCTGQWRNRWPIFLILLVLLMISWLGWAPLVQKFGKIWGSQGLDTSERLPVLLDSLKMIRDFFVTGSGFGTYEFTFPAYRSVPDASIIFDHAHNDYIELLSTGGLTGFLLAAWFVFSIIIHTTQQLLKRRERYNQLLTIAALTAIIALLLHCAVDFQMYNGANGLYFFFFCGLAVSAANTRLHFQTRPTLLTTAPNTQLLFTSALAISILAGGLWYNISAFRAQRTFAPVRSLYLNTNIAEQRLQDVYQRSETAARLDPLEGRYPFSMGSISTLLSQPERAGSEYLQAARLRPLSGRSIQQVALTLAPESVQTTEQLLALGYKYEPLVLDYYLTHANWLIFSGNKAQAMAVMKQALERQPQWAARLSTFIFLNNLSQKDMSAMLPKDPQAWHAIGRIMEKEEKMDEAEYYYLQTLNSLKGYKAQPAFFSRLYTMYTRQQKNDQALTILRRGIEYMPDNSSFHRLLGDYYRKQGIIYRAIEEYQLALQFNPKNRGLKQQIDKMQARKKGK